ncbi:hypothetical protein TWF506_001717 [Arthrobotrys conoides]|uniref:Uncharacterized protein n=1 Tax=Arthrobotrys conoides TaxID=74498 RepID=A0AAN8RYT8_9PEZI
MMLPGGGGYVSKKLGRRYHQHHTAAKTTTHVRASNLSSPDTQKYRHGHKHKHWILDRVEAASIVLRIKDLGDFISWSSYPFFVFVLSRSPQDKIGSTIQRIQINVAIEGPRVRMLVENTHTDGGACVCGP